MHVTVTAPVDASAKTTADTLTISRPVPPVKALKLDSGPVNDGVAVAITRSNFISAGVVDVGGAPAGAFTVVSASKITATVLAGSGIVDVAVATPSGASAASTADRYAYG